MVKLFFFSGKDLLDGPLYVQESNVPLHPRSASPSIICPLSSIYIWSMSKNTVSTVSLFILIKIVFFHGEIIYSLTLCIYV